MFHETSEANTSEEEIGIENYTTANRNAEIYDLDL